jgi:hypothetical protein
MIDWQADRSAISFVSALSVSTHLLGLGADNVKRFCTFCPGVTQIVQANQKRRAQNGGGGRQNEWTACPKLSPPKR